MNPNSRSKKVHDKRELSPLALWLVEECEHRGISWAEGSRRAGVSQAMISMIVRQAYYPSYTVCRAFAVAFERPVEEVLRLAGWEEGQRDRVVRRSVNELLAEIERLPPVHAAVILKCWRDAAIGAHAVAAVARAAGGAPETGADEPDPPSPG